MWHNIDITGRWVYAVTSADDPYEPRRGYYTQKEAMETHLEWLALQQILEENIKRDMAAMGLSDKGDVSSNV